MRKNIPLSEKIIVALDLGKEDEVHSIVGALGDSINFYKVGNELFTSLGADIVRYLKFMNKKVFLDLKLHDIPNTVSKAAMNIVRLGVDMFTLHASGGAAMMKATVQAVKKEAEKLNVNKPVILAVTVLTSLSRKDLLQVGIDSTPGEQVKALAKLAKDSGVDGVVASPLEINMLKKELGGGMLIVTPGIRSASATKDDQKRVMTPKEAVNNGADYLVIGRPILKAKAPKEAAEQILKEIAHVAQCN